MCSTAFQFHTVVSIPTSPLTFRVSSRGKSKTSFAAFRRPSGISSTSRKYATLTPFLFYSRSKTHLSLTPISTMILQIFGRPRRTRVHSGNLLLLIDRFVLIQTRVPVPQKAYQISETENVTPEALVQFYQPRERCGKSVKSKSRYKWQIGGYTLQSLLDRSPKRSAALSRLSSTMLKAQPADSLRKGRIPFLVSMP